MPNKTASGDPEKALQILRENLSQRKNFAANGSITVVNKAKNSSAGALFFVENPGILRMEVQDPLGAVHALLILNQDQFWWFDSHKNKAWTGDTRKARLPLPLNAEDFISLMLAQPEINENIIKLIPGEVEYRSNRNRIEKIHWNRDFEPEDWEFLIDANRTVKVQYPEYMHSNGRRLPAVVIAEIMLNGELEYKFSWRAREFSPFQKNKNLFQIPPKNLSSDIRVIKDR